ncbi:MAG: hypothetical protein JSU68_13220 [Phycisphaerales bacterium]|nr:MAG: hypothetical protein JSU68_13220 [Phycisphaerales bacterium]
MSALGRKTVFAIVAICGSLCALALLTEIILQVIDWPADRVCGWRCFWGPQHENNQLGCRGQLIEYTQDHFVAVMLGDSQVQALACDSEHMPERRLQLHLAERLGRPTKVFSLAAGGYGQDQQLLALREYFQKHRADLVVLWLTPENDVWNNMFPTHFPTDGWSKPTFWLAEGKLQGPHQPAGKRIGSGLKSALLLNQFFPRIDAGWEREHLPPPYKPIQHSGPAHKGWQRAWDENISRFREDNVANEKSHVAIGLTPRSPRMQYGLDLTNALLREIDQLARDHGADFLIFWIASGPQAASAPATASAPSSAHYADAVVYVLNGKYYRSSPRQQRDNIAEMTRGLPAFPVTHDVKDWKAPDGHLKQAAVDVAMSNLADLIVKQLR